MEIHENAITKILKYSLWGCLYLTLIMPLLVCSKFVFPFITLKTIYFRILVEIALLLYVLLALADSYYRPKMNKLLWAIAAFGLIVFITSLTGLNPYKSFWGTIERGEGFVFISHLLIFTFILSQTFKTRNQWYTFFSTSVFISLLVGFYALAQKFEVNWAIKNSAGGRFASTLGNASYLGAYSLGHFWISILLLCQRKKIWWKLIFFLSALFQVYILFQTQTRGAIIAFIIAIFCTTAGYIFISKNRKAKIISLIILFLLTSSIAFVYGNKNQPWIKNYGPFHRLVNISKKDITVQSRLYAADSSWRGWKDRFLLGYGWENYNIVFNKYFHPEIYRDNGSQIWFDRAHNTIFDIAVASGIIGLIIYLSIYFFAFRIAIRKIKKNRANQSLSFMLIAFLLAHFIQNIFVFDSLPTYLMLFSIFAFVSFLGSEKEHYAAAKNIKQKPVNIPVLVIGVMVVILLIFNLNLKPAQANIKGIQGLIYFYSNNINAAVSSFSDAIAMNTYQSPELRQKLADNILSRNNRNYVKSEDKIRANFDYAIHLIKANIEAAPYDVQNYLYLLSLYNAAAQLDIKYANQAIIYGEKALYLSPTRQHFYFELGRAKISLGKIASGIRDFQYAVNLYPKNIDSHWNLLTAYIITGQRKEAREEYQRMVYLKMPENVSNLERAAKLFATIHDYETSISLYHKIVKLKPNNPVYLSQLAVIYKEQGNLTKAKQIAQQIINMDDSISKAYPNIKQNMEEFLQLIQQQPE